MDKKIAILTPVFDDPAKEFNIREIARLTRLNHMTARKYLNQLVKEGLLSKKEYSLYVGYSANVMEKSFHNLKLYYNLEKLRKSRLIEDLEVFYEYPVIVLFGSYAQALDTKESDLDLFVLAAKKREFSSKKYEKFIHRAISLHLFSEKEFPELKMKNPELVNNICNGIALSGKLEVA